MMEQVFDVIAKVPHYDSQPHLIPIRLVNSITDPVQTRNTFSWTGSLLDRYSMKPMDEQEHYY
jgi:hypothetical protein